MTLRAPKTTDGVIIFPRQGRRISLGDTYSCDVCGFLSTSKRGQANHFRSCHEDNPVADRNWEILYFHQVHGHSPARLAYEHKLSITSIYRIIHRGITFPGIYELVED